ncbi:MAG TPA: sugar ABC transporter permease [Candidatus Methylomirabilis sp.]|nr:sugar ABC transporter permease [Candidatus Methylomirabilis sp.]HSB79187.1 sugar ABC transporter permease [Candidatus Methylomirabilis sp.]
MPKPLAVPWTPNGTSPAERMCRLLRINRLTLAKYSFCYLGLLPVFVIYWVLRLEPIARTFILSFYDWHLIRPLKPFVGLANYRDLLQDDNFLLALKNTTLFAVFVVGVSVLLGLALAVLLAGNLRGTAAYQAVYFLPVIIPMVPMAIAWKWIFDARYGILNYLLSWFGVQPIGWLTSPDVAMWAIIIMSVWKVLGYNMVLLLVGLKNIPAEFYEAASIDGAAGWAMFRRITLPLLKPILLFVVVISTINAYNVFTQVYVMTTGSQAAPGAPLRVLVFDIYQNGFQFFKMGYASAEAVVLTLIVLALTLIQFRIIRLDGE